MTEKTIELITLLLKEPMGGQIYGKEIRQLFTMLEVLNKPILVN